MTHRSRAAEVPIGYAQFIELCRVNDPKDFGGFHVEHDGIYTILPDANIYLTPEERATLAWHPTGNYDDPAFCLPSTLAELQNFIADAGLCGCIDEDLATGLLSGPANPIADEGTSGTSPEVQRVAAGATGGIDPSAKRTRHDGLRVAMEAGYQAMVREHGTEPTARALFDWLSGADLTCNIVDFTADKLIWRKSNNDYADTDFKAFQNRFTRLTVRNNPQ